jgi:hypothetical protein
LRARWGDKPTRATHRGNFKDEFGIDVECYVLDDEQKTAVISQRGMGAALGLSGSSGASLPRFLGSGNLAPYVGAELGEKLANPLIFQWSSVVLNMPLTTIYGYDVTMLIDICKATIRAFEDGKLAKRQEHIVRQAHVILNASAKAGIKGLVYALAGYDATREEVGTGVQVLRPRGGPRVREGIPGPALQRMVSPVPASAARKE